MFRPQRSVDSVYSNAYSKVYKVNLVGFLQTDHAHL